MQPTTTATASYPATHMSSRPDAPPATLLLHTEIQRQIGEVNEMFQDLAVLINDQGEQLQTIDVQISSTAERVREGGQQLVAADRSQRAARNKCLMLWLVSGIVVAIILVVLFA